VLVLTLAMGASASQDCVTTNSAGFCTAEVPREWVFPRDHGAHPGYQTEWWYVTGNVTDDAGRPFGFQFTIFRREVTTSTEGRRSIWAVREILLAHGAISDIERRRFYHAEAARRPVAGMAGASTGTLHVWVDGFQLDGTDAAVPWRLRAVGKDFSYDLSLQALKPPVFHGPGGVERKGDLPGQASYYYSMSRLATSGTLVLDGRSWNVSGEAWMDHEFGSATLADNQAGWDWFGLQLDDGTELMAYRMRLKGGGEDRNSAATLIAADGQPQWFGAQDFRITPRGEWRSPRSGAVYPAAWRIEIPARALDLEVVPRAADQELATRGTTGVTYWEGSVTVEGTSSGAAVKGLGYAELTGYAESMAGRF
jgi:predicted secreted hydrolase